MTDKFISDLRPQRKIPEKDLTINNTQNRVDGINIGVIFYFRMNFGVITKITKYIDVSRLFSIFTTTKNCKEKPYKNDNPFSQHI